MSNHGFSLAFALALAAVAAIGACERHCYWRDQQPSRPVGERSQKSESRIQNSEVRSQK